MPKILKYEDIKQLETENSILLTTKEEFETLKKNRTTVTSKIRLKWKCHCGEVFERDYAIQRKSPTRECRHCVALNLGKTLTDSEADKIKFIESLGFEYISGELTSRESLVNVRCSGCGKIFKTKYGNLKGSRKTKRGFNVCQECRTKLFVKENGIVKVVENRPLIPYEEVCEWFEKRGCVLLTKKEDYKGVCYKVRYIASCGHERETMPSEFNSSEDLYNLCKKCSIAKNSGENAYNWNGGSSLTEREVHKRKTWSKNVFKRDKYTCQCCGANSCKIHAHHLDSFDWCVEKREDVSNGITLCKECHIKFHQKYGYGKNTKSQFEDFMKNSIHRNSED